MKTPGLAYGVFKCSDPRPRHEVLARFKEALENVKLAHEETKVPQNIEFTIHPLPEGIMYLGISGDSVLVPYVMSFLTRGANFIIRAALPETTNEKTAHELGYTLNCLYGGTELFDAENEKRVRLVMDVFFRDGASPYLSKLRLDLDSMKPHAG